jgi:membrane fusion protein (multidrug efflux system)
MKKISKGIYLILVLVLIVASYFIFHKSKDQKQMQGAQAGRKAVKVDAYIASPQLLINEITVSGSLLAYDEVQLLNEVAGRVIMVNLPEGKFVKAGTLLVKLYDADLQANLKKLQTQLDSQEKIFKRQGELLKVNGISQNDYDQAALQVDAIKAEVEIVKVQIRKTEVLAPFDGVLGLKNISIGAQITPSTLLATIRSEKNLKLDFSVPEKYSPLVKQGMKVKFSAFNDDNVYNANVIASENGIDVSTRNLKVRALVNSNSKELIPGAFVNVLLRLSENPKALMVPTQAVIPQDQSEYLIVAKNGLAHFSAVKTGMRKTAKIEITEGLQVGDTVITSGILFLKEGSKILYSTVRRDSI